MSVGAICFTSSGSNGGCWVVLVFPRLFLWKNGFFFPIRDLRKKKSIRDLHPKKKFPSKKKRDLHPKKKVTRLTPKKKSDLRLFPQLSYAFLLRVPPSVGTLSVTHRRTYPLNPPPLLSTPSPKQPAPDKKQTKVS